MYNIQPICNLVNPTSNFGLIDFPQHNINSQHNAMNIFFDHVLNLATSEDEFHALVDYIEHTLWKCNNKKLEAQWWEECGKNIVEYVDNKM
jgi:hypothetical protein